MAIKLSPEMAAIDREISRINRQIRQAYKTFGSEGRLAEQYATLLGTRARGSLRSVAAENTGIIREGKDGIPQISRSKQALNIYQASKPAQRAIKQLSRMQTVQSAKAAMVKAYEKRTGETVGKSRSAKKAAFEAELEDYKQKQINFNNARLQMYALEKKKGGIRFKAHDEIKMMSKGRWTSAETFKAMQEKIDAVLRGEDERIQTNLLQGY